MIKVREYDYSDQAKLEHKRTLQVVDALNARGIKASVASISLAKNKKKTRAAVIMLKAIFDMEDRIERKVMWQEFKCFVKKYRLSVDLFKLLQMRKLWRDTKQQKAA